MNDTAINWTELTWNPMSGCEKVSEGCKYCYALTLAENKRGTAAFPNGFELTIRQHKLIEPFKLKQPSLIFVNSMSDLFWDKVPADYRDKIVDVIEQTPQHQYQVLTKRPEAMLAYSKRRKLPSNFWAGTTIEAGRTAHRLDLIREIDVPIRFLSVEPLIGIWEQPHFDGIQWVIVGGESGSHLSDPAVAQRRALVMNTFDKWVPMPSRKDWVRIMRDACQRDHVAFWFKQWGGPTPHSAGRSLDGRTWDEYPMQYKPAQAITVAQVAAPVQLALLS